MSALVATHFSMIHLKCFPCICKCCLDPQFRKDPEISWGEKFLIPQPGSWNSGIWKWVSCVVPSPQCLQAVIWGAGRMLQLAELLLPEHGSEQGTHCQLQHLLTGNRARSSDAISILSLAKIPTSRSTIKLKSWLSYVVGFLVTANAAYHPCTPHALKVLWTAVEVNWKFFTANAPWITCWRPY